MLNGLVKDLFVHLVPIAQAVADHAVLVIDPDRMPVHLHPKTIDKVDADKRHHPGIDKRGSHAADRNIIGDQEIRLPYDFIDTSHNGIKRLYNQPH